jgi:subtilisin family serine protease
VTVAVLDTGTDAAAPDLAGSVTTGPDYTEGADPPGYQPPHLHGTYIASLIAGHGSGPGRSGGVIGVAPAAKILAVRVILDDQEPGFAIYSTNPSFASAIPDGIRYAVSHGAEVINMSLGSTTPTRDMRLAIGYAVSHDVIIVASAGNDGSAGGGFTPYSYPASFTGVISVAAVGATGQRASFSDRNASVVISAPGVNIVGAGPGGTYLSGSGTSPASAFVAGVAALIRSKYPRLTPALVTQALVASAQHRPAGGYSPGLGFGEVDAVAALAAAARLADQPAITGLRASARFGGGPSPGPIQVVHRSYPKIVALAAVAAVALLCFLIALCLVVLQLRRRHARKAPERDATFKLDFP